MQAGETMECRSVRTRAAAFSMFSNTTDLDLRLIRVFLAVVDARGITAAEASLGVRQSTISTQLSALEARVGFKLCDRGRGGFRLTSKGERFAATARTLVTATSEFVARVRDIDRKLVGTLAIGLIGQAPLVENARVAEAIGAFRERGQHRGRDDPDPVGWSSRLPARAPCGAVRAARARAGDRPRQFRLRRAAASRDEAQRGRQADRRRVLRGSAARVQHQGGPAGRIEAAAVLPPSHQGEVFAPASRRIDKSALEPHPHRAARTEPRCRYRPRPVYASRRPVRARQQQAVGTARARGGRAVALALDSRRSSSIVNP